MKKNSTPKEMSPWEKEYQRYHQIYNSLVLASIVAIIAAFYFIGLFWGFATLAFAFWSFGWYEDGATEDCMDEYEYAYPKDGFRRMFKSWPWFFGLATIAYFICKAGMPWLF